MASNIRVLVFGAHPDDDDLQCGGTAIKLSKAGHTVKFVSCTNGGTGHHEIGGIELVRRRYEEAQRAAKVAGIAEYQVLDIHNGELEASVMNRKTIIRIIREFKPDLIITHRPYDYHPDHRITSQLVQDASYIMSVPNMLPLTEAMTEFPVICYMSDTFQKPIPFSPDIVIGIDDVFDRKVEMIHSHTSQMYEWLPYNRGVLHTVPTGDEERKEWLREHFLNPRDRADRYRNRLIELYGEAEGKAIRYAEAFEVCEYGRPLALTRTEIENVFVL